jgi:hypothetical protein
MNRQFLAAIVLLAGLATAVDGAQTATQALPQKPVRTKTLHIDGELGTPAPSKASGASQI